jgi:beta-galactosidase/beta-glucuronidase
MLRRPSWVSLDGTWDFAIDRDGHFRAPGDVRFDRRIEVPFAPETERSGIADRDLYKSVWYRRTLETSPLAPDERWILHFGAVDYVARVWIDGALAMTHEGGYSPFSADVTDRLGAAGATTHELVVHAYDDPADLAKPRGKQDWQLEPHSIWYPRTTGIWQTVWLEPVHETHIASVRWTSNLELWEIALDAIVASERGRHCRLEVTLHAGEVIVAEDTYSVVGGEVHRRISLSDPGIDDFRNEILWSPEAPKLIDAVLRLVDEDDGRVLDEARSYTALRSLAIDGDRFVLNGRPYPLRLVLDQGYWPETGLTAPDDAALRRDVELTRALGFNGARKHQKIEDPRWLYWCDRLGLLVWAEMPSAYRFTRESVERLAKQWAEVIARDASHPCIVAWVPFNESWGVPNLPASASERHYVQALYHLTKTLDPTRPVVGNDGWESVATDVIGIHDYDASPQRIAERYQGYERLPALFARERPGGRALVLGERANVASARPEHPIVLSEFGGIALGREPTEWGYSHASGAEDFERRYTALLEVVRSLPVLSGFCYTQLTDTYQEANGLLYMDRTPKVPIERIARATRGADPIAAAPGERNERNEAPE